MSLKKRVLVFPCGSEIGLELHRSLGRAKEVVLFGGASVPDHGEYVYSRYIGGIPFVDAPDFIEALNAVIRENSIDYVFPAHDSVVLALAKAYEQGLLACRVLTSSHSTCRICRSKKNTLELFNGVLRVPALYGSVADVKAWPVFLKPDVGQGSKGAQKAENADICALLLKRAADLLIMEYLPGPEFTVDCFTDASGELIFCQPRTRARIMNGISVKTAPVSRPDLNEMAGIINGKLSLRGAWFFQVKEAEDGQPALMEIAPRVAGAMGFCRGAGVNLPLMTIYDAEGYTVSAMPNPEMREMDRALSNMFRFDYDYSHVYVDLDDCLICGGQVNTELAAFLYQCINKNISLRLLTRHAGELDETLSKHRLVGLFDEIIHLKMGESKASAIKHLPAIFIDDSFAERLDVRKNFSIPVFAPDAVEGLII